MTGSPLIVCLFVGGPYNGTTAKVHDDLTAVDRQGHRYERQAPRTFIYRPQ